MASHPGTTRQNMLNYCRQSLEANRAPLPIMDRQNNEGQLTSDNPVPALIRNNIDLCERAIAGNKSPAEAT
jgi:hypothetical protein